MKKLGVYFLEDFKAAAEPLCYKLLVKGLGGPEEKVKDFAKELIPALGAKRTYAYLTV